jgi:hypothetical protein
VSDRKASRATAEVRKTRRMAATVRGGRPPENWRGGYL